MGLSHFSPAAPHPFVCWNKKRALSGAGPCVPQAGVVSTSEARSPKAGGQAGPPVSIPLSSQTRRSFVETL